MSHISQLHALPRRRMMPDDVGIRQSALYFQIKRHSRVIRRTQTHTHTHRHTMCASLCKCVCTYMCIWKCRPNVSWFFHLLPSPPPFFFRAHISFIYRVDGGIKLMSFAYRDSRRIVGKCQLTFEASEAGFGSRRQICIEYDCATGT